jgi:long-chain acyl-CoA synthetase
LILFDRGIKIAYATDVTTLPDELLLFSPTLLVGVPRVSTSGSTTRRSTRPPRRARAASSASRSTRPPSTRVRPSTRARSLRDRVKHGLFDKLVYGKLRAAFGGKLRVAVSGGAPLGERLGYFFNGVGVTLLEGYGLTETSPVLSANFPDDIGVATVGYPLPGTEIRIADDGEVLARGPQVFQGYWHNEAATREVLDEDGWFHTGDLGDFDTKGRLRITGRAKDLIITAGGKNVSPATLEDRLRAHPLIGDSVVVGDNRPYIAALIALDAEALPEWAAEHGKSGISPAELRHDPDLRTELDAAVADANAAVSRAEQIRTYTVLPRELTILGGELTPTMKVRRATVMKEYDQLIEELYLTGAGS